MSFSCIFAVWLHTYKTHTPSHYMLPHLQAQLTAQAALMASQEELRKQAVAGLLYQRRASLAQLR